jgi:hypothetical protein
MNFQEKNLFGEEYLNQYFVKTGVNEFILS